MLYLRAHQMIHHVAFIRSNCVYLYVCMCVRVIQIHYAMRGEWGDSVCWCVCEEVVCVGVIFYFGSS